MLPLKTVEPTASLMVNCKVHSMRSSNAKLSSVQRLPFMNSRMASSSASNLDASTLLIWGAMTLTVQFNSCESKGSDMQSITNEKPTLI